MIDSYAFTKAAQTTTKAFSLADLRDAAKKIEDATFPGEWLLMSPNGDVWRGSPDDLVRALVPHHSFMAMPPVFTPTEPPKEQT